MWTHSERRSFVGHALARGSVVACLLGVCIVSGAEEPTDGAATLPEGVTAFLTKDQLATKVPNFFAFAYPFVETGELLWMRIDAGTWLQTHPDGTENRYKNLGHATVKEQGGTVVVSQTENESSGQGFIPDKGSPLMAMFCRFRANNGWGEWQDLSWSRMNLMTNVK